MALCRPRVVLLALTVPVFTCVLLLPDRPRLPDQPPAPVVTLPGTQGPGTQGLGPPASPGPLKPRAGTAPQAPKASDTLLVPNLVHFIRIRGAQVPLDFTEMMSIKSAHKIQNPDALYLHCDYTPTGQSWVDLIAKVQINVIHRKLPTNTEKVSSDSLELASDVIKLEVLREYGGVTIETDVIIIQSLDPLRHYNFSIGHEKSPRMSMDVLLANKDSVFLSLILESLNATKLPWQPHNDDLGTRAYKLTRKHRDLVHVEEESLSTPDWVHRYLLFTDNDYFRWWRRNLYVVRFMLQNNEGSVYNPEYIKTLKNLVGKVLRFVYYGSPDLQDPYLPHILYATKPNNT